MGLLLSVLIGCVGVIELLDVLKHRSEVISPKSPVCLSYHEPDTIDHPISFHDSICGISHSNDLNLSIGKRCKLENLHEYSLRVRSQLRSRGYDDASTLSDFSCRDIFGMSRPDSRASLDFDFVHDDDDDDDDDEKHLTTSIDVVDDQDSKKIIPQHKNTIKLSRKNNDYARLSSTNLFSKQSQSNSSTDLSSSVDNNSDNELAIKEITDDARYQGSSSSPQSSIETTKVSKKHRRKKCAKTSKLKLSIDFDVVDPLVFIQDKQLNYNDNNKKILDDKKIDKCKNLTNKLSDKRGKIVKSTSVLRKQTRLKSRNAEISKSAENINDGDKLKKKRERRKSDISVQTMEGLNYYRDEWTNTSPDDCEKSISSSRQSISVEVQTNFDDDDDEYFDKLITTTPKSESKKERINSKKKLLFKRKLNLKSRSLDDNISNNNYYYEFDESNLPGISVRDISLFDKDKDTYNWNLTKEENSSSCLKILNTQTFKTMTNTMHENEEDSIDEEFLDAVETVTSEAGSIHYCIPPCADSDKAFWLIFSGEYTKAMNKDWHSGHFCCWQCDESLTGQRYVLRDEHPYCITCYESVFANGCEECGKIIGIDSKVNSCKDLSYKDKHWHEACFLCYKCRVSLVEKQFGSKGDKIYCGNCYDSQFASRCDGCGEVFRAGTKKMEYKTRQWHEKCFCCVVCKNAIGLKSFIPREQEIYCAGCYEDKFATRCIKCNKVITSGGVTYKNDPWHRECFTCTNCDSCLAGQRFTSRDEKPYCAECFGELFAKRCTSCVKPITGIGGTRFISFEDRHWHNDCFICAGCKCSLVGRGFITDGDDIICPECAKQKLTE